MKIEMGFKGSSPYVALKAESVAENEVLEAMIAKPVKLSVEDFHSSRVGRVWMVVNEERTKVGTSEGPAHGCNEEFDVSPYGWFNGTDLLWTCRKCRMQWAQRGSEFRPIRTYENGLPVNPFGGV